MRKITIALDGPAGAGKSTVAKEIAKLKNLVYIDTGAMYRAVTLNFLCNEISIEDEKQVKETLSKIDIDLDSSNVYLNGQCVNEEIRTPIVTKNVSAVSAIGKVREKMVELQRKIAEGKSVIMDGRDIGTFVLPKAEYKFFLTASIEERAHRRYEEFIKKGFDVNLEDIKRDIGKRDKIDSEREIAPLKKADDAIEIDSTRKNINEVIKEILSFIE
ncbi:(d)CMP kinase [Anaeromicrobium sediminis]|uniref:Cytidylate kinase n=1 Tax=Anaeromicrobium sediminis TaxID=1478221 RepID=A0A267MNL0_9FIRM|nr:(d)CMP kinase [Anaeromicrobium sediminis]PAB61169.1 cytidylate kinase [Anaeromicrobium sediminis]